MRLSAESPSSESPSTEHDPLITSSSSSPLTFTSGPSLVPDSMRGELNRQWSEVGSIAGTLEQDVEEVDGNVSFGGWQCFGGTIDLGYGLLARTSVAVAEDLSFFRAL